jgi:hypothetical protein
VSLGAAGTERAFDGPEQILEAAALRPLLLLVDAVVRDYRVWHQRNLAP